MSRKVYRISIVLHALWMLSAGSALADDASGMREGDDRWTPSIAMVLGFTSQNVQGSFDSCRFGFLQCNQTFRPVPFRDNDNWLNNIVIGGTLQIETPALPIPLHPRFFVSGEISHVSSQRRTIAKEADPKTVLIEPDAISFPDASILGQGSATEADTDNLQFGAVAGISFPVDIGDWQLAIKPSARYLKQQIDFTGIVSDGDRPGDLAAPPPTTVVLLQGAETKDVHAVGPGLEIELSAIKIRSLGASVFVSGGAYRVLSDRTASFRDQRPSNLGTGLYRADWKGEIDAWIYRASVGFRVSWMGARSGWLFGATD